MPKQTHTHTKCGQMWPETPAVVMRVMFARASVSDTDDAGETPPKVQI